jgi:3-hydroxyisobutyrate dehydrogenase
LLIFLGVVHHLKEKERISDMAIGFIGLGNLGTAIARRLISEGEELIVWNRSRLKAEELGAQIADSPADLISRVSICFLCLSDSNAVKAVLEDRKGILHGDCSGKIVADITTNHFETVRSFYTMLGERGGSYLETPVSGSVVPASQGNLVVLVSGDNKSFETVRPLLRKIGKHIFFLEKPSLASRMKLVNNLVLAAFMIAIGEALAFGEDVGIPRKTILDVLSVGAGNSAVLTGKKEKLLNDDFTPQFSVAMISKDLKYIEDLAKAQNRPLFCATVAGELFNKAIAARMETLDFSSIYKVIKE